MLLLHFKPDKEKTMIQRFNKSFTSKIMYNCKKKNSFKPIIISIDECHQIDKSFNKQKYKDKQP